jgi:hypothetical protein
MAKPIAIVSIPVDSSNKDNMKDYLQAMRDMLQCEYFVLFEFGHFEQMNIRIFSAPNA